ncbi:2-hydroxyacyl-CoA lyase 2-like [Eriocheir sinensis]|uniref:2-hydroxyacyl-CoA lyase 2-like n=1 Tax=Eriocheir sinensis TaxID=95602 RepID=UPI0021C639EF|nr:2-hydroxyacyl-CoA lyase 2-like [Eriocheir sinensis]XP_050732913.1 2-hydroxyacyl-CoA lyase 2-like [Eriocheir sinensis]XP_050732914.1 2-hydroxyacyl-CoA lyase 2-like [Eriocheir sinensis]XP_050732915.1 2-hydroxyacyl-CoA lyase 2-like [Eriocheir sinensis]XP_050732916.1 2-hydroxyacyl-CoA lyase 2-like [Eriocheir sinensis]
MNEQILELVAIFSTTTLIGLGVAAVLKMFNLPFIWMHQVNKESKRHGGELVAEVLKSHGVRHIFTLPGGHISPISVAAEKLGIQIVDTRHEAAAAFAADAVARMSGMVGVVAVTAGPGLTNAVTAIKNAQMAQSPVLLLGGAAASILKGRGALQDIDQMSLFKPLCKFCATVTCVRNIVPTLQKALQEAQSGTPGPVFVEFPIDVLYPYHMVAKEVGVKGEGKSFMQKIVNWYLGNYLDNLFAGAWEPQDTKPLKVNIPFASSDTVSRCVEIVSRSKKPVIVLGSQATLPPTPVEDLRRSLENLGIPCYLGGMSRGLLGRKSPLQMRQKRRDALKEADCIILAGAVCDFRLSYGRVLGRKAKIIAINRNKTELYKNSDMFWKPTEAVVGDVATFLRDLSAGLAGYQCDSEWLSTLRERDEAKEQDNMKMAEEVTEKHLNPMKVFTELEELLPSSAVLVADGGDFVATAAYILRPRGPLTWLDPGAFGTLGVGGGFALGAKLCRPDSEIWIIYGDGSFGYSLAEIDTYTRHKTPVIALVGNDAGWTQITREQVTTFGSSVGCDLVHCDYHTAAEGLGAKGILLGRNDSISDKLKEAQELHAEGHSVVVNCLIGSTKFREGSISV